MGEVEARNLLTGELVVEILGMPADIRATAPGACMTDITPPPSV
jgi:hypothetical protein